MKKTICVLLAALFLCALAACGAGAQTKPAEASAPAAPATSAPAPEAPSSANAPEKAEPAPADSAEGRRETLVAYFSATGTTRGVAEKIAAITDADLYEITAAEPYSSADLNYND